jgi:hypothetical protein
MIIRPECKRCNHFPVCKDELKMNLWETCPYFESEFEKSKLERVKNE